MTNAVDFSKRYKDDLHLIGFPKNTKLILDDSHVFGIGPRTGYILPPNFIEIVVGDKDLSQDKLKQYLRYIRKDSPNKDLDLKVGLLIDSDKDKQIQYWLRNPQVYTNERVYTESKLDSTKGRYIDLAVYVGDKHVAICTPIIRFE